MGWLAALTLEDPGHRFTRISHLLERVNLHEASLESYPSIFSAFSKHTFEGGYRLAAQSLLAKSFADGCSTMKTNINGSYYTLAALRELHDFY